MGATGCVHGGGRWCGRSAGPRCVALCVVHSCATRGAISPLFYPQLLATKAMMSRPTVGLVVLLLHVVCTQHRATDAAGAVGHEQLGTVLTDLTGALGRGRGDAHIGHFAGNTGAYLSHTLSPWA